MCLCNSRSTQLCKVDGCPPFNQSNSQVTYFIIIKKTRNRLGGKTVGYVIILFREIMRAQTTYVWLDVKLPHPGVLVPTRSVFCNCCFSSAVEASSPSIYSSSVHAVRGIVATYIIPGYVCTKQGIDEAWVLPTPRCCSGTLSLHVLPSHCTARCNY